MLYPRRTGLCGAELRVEWPGSGFPRSSVIYKYNLPARSPRPADPYKQQEAPHPWNISNGSYSPPW